MRHTVSVIVPAYNEEKRIDIVLGVLLASKDVNEVSCINDVSRDTTRQIIKIKKQVILIDFPINHGKSYAIAQGILKAKGDIVVFVDASGRIFSPNRTLFGRAVAKGYI